MTALQPTINATLFAGSPQNPATSDQTAPAISSKTWIAVIGATLGAFMAVLNIQIVNASLADIQGAIGAGIDDGGWISTSYLIAEIVVIPLSGWLAQVFSIRRYLLTDTQAALFSPARNMEERRVTLRLNRKTKVQPSQQDRRKRRMQAEEAVQIDRRVLR